MLLPYHHVVSDDALPHIQNLYSYKNRKAFIKDLDWLLKNYSPVHPGEFAQHLLAGKPLPSDSFLLSFDDGYRQVFDVVAPILYQKGVPAIFFINPAFIDNRELFYRCKLSLVLEKIKSDDQLLRSISQKLAVPIDYSEVRKKILEINYHQQEKVDDLGRHLSIDFDRFLRLQNPFLTTVQIKELLKQGFNFGAHSWDHPHYALLSLQQQLDQTERSLKFVRDLQKSHFQFFSFPHQDKMVQQAFFTEILSRHKNLLLFGLQNQRFEDGNKMFHRYNVEDPGTNLQTVTKGILLYNNLLSLAGKRNIHRK